MRVLGKIKKICLVFMVVAMVLTLSGCGSSSSKSEQESSTKTDDKTVAIHAGKIKVYLDEAKY